MNRLHRAGALVLALALCLPVAALAQDAKALYEQAYAAYTRKDYLRSAELYLAAAKADETDATLVYNAACSFALAGKTEEAFGALERAVALGMNPKQIAGDSDLAALHADPRWSPLLARAESAAKAHAVFWNSPAMATPFKPALSDEEKIAGLSKLWSEAKFNFIHFDHLDGLDWDALYMEYLPKARAAATTLDYYRVLTQFLARLEDGHTNVWLPRELFDEAWAVPLVRTRLVEGKVIVVDVIDEQAAPGIAVGDEVIEVDGVPVAAYAERRVKPYQSASTPQDLETRVYEYGLLQGPIDRAVELTLRDATGATAKRRLTRVNFMKWWNSRRPAPMTFTMLPGNVAHVTLSSFNDDQAAEMFESAFAEIAKADALVLDVRENGGGNSSVGYRVLACLTDAPFVGSQWRTREYRPAFRAWGRREGSYAEAGENLSPNGRLLFTKPVVVLTSARTYSAAEDFAVAFKGMKRGSIVGEPTGGSTGQPLSFPLPGGGGARICTKHDSLGDGTEFVGVGVQPDVVVRPTVSDVRAGHDAVLAAALRSLGN